jgi:hypothetical protein
MKTAFLILLVALCLSVSVQARDCSISQEFQFNRPQILAGILQDPVGAVLSGFELELLSGKKTIRRLRTSTDGKYDFGEVPVGYYRIRIRYGGNPFCTPQIVCSSEKCSLPRLTLNPRSMVQVE